MWDFLQAALEFLEAISGPVSDTLKDHVRAVLPEYRAFKQAQQAQRNSVGFDSPQQQAQPSVPTEENQTRTRRLVIPPHT